ncbi:MAG: hypothetical protein Q9157_002639 [Trypethelium eluteriae]
MDRIYASAEKVLVWLGPASPKASDIAIDALRNLARINVNALGLALMNGVIDISDPDTYTTLGISSISRKTWKDIRDFYERAWFQRTWVTQEAALAQSISFHFGPYSLSWKELDDASHNIFRLGLPFASSTAFLVGVIQSLVEPDEDLQITEATSLAFSSINTIRSVRLQHERGGYGTKRRPLPRAEISYNSSITATKEYGGDPESWKDFWKLILHKTRQNQASDPRDKIYGFLGLLRGVTDKSGREIIIPSYEADNTVQKLYTEVTRKLTVDQPEAAYTPQTNSTTRVPPIEDRSVRIQRDLPSWVPDYSAPQRPRPLISSSVTCFHYRASLHMTGGFFETGNVRWYGIRGMLVSEVAAIGESYDELKETCSVRRCLQMLTSLPNDNDRAETLARTLIANHSLGFEVQLDEVAAIFRSYMTLLKTTEIHREKRGKLKNEDDNTLLSDIERSCEELNILGERWRPHISDVFDSLTALRNKSSIRARTGLDKALIDLASRYESALDLLFDCRRFFLTIDARVGIGPRSTSPGDEVWLLPPERNFHILRRQSKGRHELLGDAYVHDIMFGEFTKFKWEEDLVDVCLV